MDPGTLEESPHSHYAPYLYRDEGKIAEIQLPNIEQEHFYIEPHKSSRLEILEPFLYPLGNEEILMTTVAKPIFRTLGRAESGAENQTKEQWKVCGRCLRN